MTKVSKVQAANSMHKISQTLLNDYKIKQHIGPQGWALVRATIHHDCWYFGSLPFKLTAC